MCLVLLGLCLSTNDCVENRRLAKVSENARGSSMLFYNERLEPDSSLFMLVIQRSVTGDTGYGSRWYTTLRFGYSGGALLEKKKVARNQWE